MIASGKFVQDRTPKTKHQLTKESTRLINFFFLITCPLTQILLKMSFSCTFLETMKLSSQWLSKDEVQRWDTSPETTELRLIGCSTESIWNPRFKSNMSTPKTNSQTFWPKEVSQEMNGIIFFVCSTSWVSRCSLAAISVIFFLIRSESRAPCQKEGKRRFRTKALRRQNQSLWYRRRRDHSTWYHAVRGVRKTLHRIWVMWSIWRMPMNEKEWKLQQGKPLQIASKSEVGYSQVSRQDNALIA